MRTDALVGIPAIVVLLVLALALPAAASDCTLGIFGNANEDETINMQDVTYTELIILEYRDKTELADAKYDGKINMQDVTQIELVILGKEKEMTIVDAEGAAKTVSMPVEEIIALNSDCIEAIRAIGANDRIVGIESSTSRKTLFFPELSMLPSIGRGSGPDIEKILEMEPDIVIAYAPKIYNPGHEELEDKLEPAVTVIRLDLFNRGTDKLREEMMKLGFMLGEVENALGYVEWYDGYVDTIEERVLTIPDADKPTVFLDWCASGDTARHTMAKGGLSEVCEKAGGNNIAADLPVPYPVVDLEWILERNPEVIVGYSHGRWFKGGCGYETDDESDVATYHEEIMGLVGFANMEAVGTGRVHIMGADIVTSPVYPVGLAYQAKWFHPELFEDLDPEAIHQEYIDEFCGIDYDVAEHGVFVYPPFEES